MMTKQEQLGQYFTPDWLVKEMIALRQNDGSILEPSCGSGQFSNIIPNCIGIEIDSSIAPSTAIIMDYFDWHETVNTIIGNPPYVAYKNILPETQKKLPPVLDNRTNLSNFFIWHSIDILLDGGELIFVVPRDFIKATSCASLNKRLFNEGGFTYWKEYGDEIIFSNAAPNVCVFRWVKGQPHSIPVSYSNGYLYFSLFASRPLIKSLFDIKVGGASGANDIFFTDTGNIDLVVSSTKKTQQTIKAYYTETPNEYLLSRKDELLRRKIKNFTEENWWEWGRKINHITGDKIYVNCKTRDPKPFFTHQSGWFDGSVLALIPKSRWYDNLDDVIFQLNNNDWENQGFKVGGRLIFGQKSLENAYYFK